MVGGTGECPDGGLTPPRGSPTVIVRSSSSMYSWPQSEVAFSLLSGKVTFTPRTAWGNIRRTGKSVTPDSGQCGNLHKGVPFDQNDYKESMNACIMHVHACTYA